MVFQKGALGGSYNIGTKNEKTNLDLAKKICQLLDKAKPKSSGSYVDQIAFVQDRAGHDFRYAIEHSKITNELGWNPQFSFEQALKNTIDWYMKTYST
jgi:dTDP-glucose 4,6-dehydratase